MGMLKSIDLENYKCFENSCEIKIAPLTVLCGVNSSGKSSIINSLLMLKQSYENNLSSNNMTFNSSYLKCGSFEDISSNKNNNPISFNVTYELERPTRYRKKSKELKSSKFDITAFKTLSKIYPNKFNITKFYIKSCIVIKKIVEENSTKSNILDKHSIEISLYDNENFLITTKISLEHKQGNQYLITAENIPNGVKTLESKVILKSCACYFENFNLINAYASYIEPRGTMVDGILANIYLIFRINTFQYKNLNYLTPLRVYPQRNYILEDELENVGNGGEYTPHIMHKYSQENIVGFYPPTEEQLLADMSIDNFPNFLNSWMEYLNFGNYSLKQALETIKLDISNYNISNVGFGISQVLPILVSGLIQCKNEVLLLEQPEIHLHPGAQMRIADFLLSMAVSKKGVIIETHSDHIINRIVKRILQDKSGDLNKIVNIYYVNGDDKENPITSIIIDPQRGITNAPEQFFTQFGSESMMIARYAMENYREGIKW